MTTQDELYNSLWDYAYGLLEPDEVRALEDRITSEHAVARAYAEVRQQADHLQAAARIDAPLVQLESPAALPPPSATPEPTCALASQQAADPLAVRGMRWLLAAAALVLIALAVGNWWQAAAWRDAKLLAQVEQDLATQQTRLVVLASNDFDANLTRQVSVQATNLLGESQAARLTWQFVDSDGVALATEHGQTAEDGRVDLQVDASQFANATQLNFWCEQQPEVPRPEVPPLVVPLQPAPTNYATTIVTDKPTYRAGEAVYFRSLTLQQLPPNYVRDFHVAYRFGSASGQASELPQWHGLTEHGVGNGVFHLTENVPSGRYNITALSKDAEFPTATAWFDVAGDSTELWNKQFVFSKRVYTPGEEVEAKVRAITPAGEPVANLEVKLGAIVNGGAVELRQDEAKTNESGEYVTRFVLPMTPLGGEAQLNATLTDGTRIESISQSFTVQPAPLEIDAAALGDYLLTTIDAQSARAAGIALNVTAPATTDSDRALVVSATCRDVAVGQKFVTLEQGRSTVNFELPIAPQAAGPIRVSLYDYEANDAIPLAACWVDRPVANYWQITAQPSPDGGTDATTQTWEVQVADETNQPGRATLGVRVVAVDVMNQVVTAQAESLLTEVATRTTNLSIFDDTTSAGPTNDLALANVAPPLQRWDNLPEATAALESATHRWSAERSQQLQQTAQWIAVGSVVLMLTIVLMLILKLAGREAYWLSMLTVGAATLLVSITWFGAQLHSPSGLIVKRLTDEQLQVASTEALHTPPVTPAEAAPVIPSPVIAGVQGEQLRDLESHVDPHENFAVTQLHHLPNHFSLPPIESRYTNGGNWSFGTDLSYDSGWRRLQEQESLTRQDRWMRPRRLERLYESRPLASLSSAWGITSDQLSDFDSDTNQFAYLYPARLPVTTFTATTTNPAPDTLYWQPLLMTDENGRARLQLPKPPTNRAYRLFINAHGNGRLGSFDRELPP